MTSYVVIGAVGRLVQEKGYRELFEAWKRISVDAPKARLLVVGPSEPDKADGISAADIERRLPGIVDFAGIGEYLDLTRFRSRVVQFLLGYKTRRLQAAPPTAPPAATA